MSLYCCLLSTLLTGQVAAGVPVVIPPQTMPRDDGARNTGFSRNLVEPAAGPLAGRGTKSAPSHATPDQLLIEALTPPTNGSTGGQPLTLLSAIASAADRPRQLEAIHGYWRLVNAIGDYHYLLERQQRLLRLPAAKDEAGDLRTAQAIATARLHEAEIHLSAAQHELAATLHLPEMAALPWPADRPLTDAYRTRFAELFAGKRPPDRTRMLDKTLPLRQRAVESHAAAVLAAEESLDATLELHSTGQRPLARVLQTIDAAVQQQQAFLASACRYNDDVADYALTVVPPQTTPEILVTTLIVPMRPAAGPLTGNPTVPAGFQQAPTAPAHAVPATAEIARPPLPLTSAGAPAPPQARATAEQPATGSSSPHNDETAPGLLPPQESAIPLVPPAPEETAPPANERKSSGMGAPRSAFKPIMEDALQASAPQLAAKLYENRNSAITAEQPLRLVDCLQSSPPGRRLEAIDAYWTARQAAADYRLLAEEKQWLDALKPAVAAQNPPSPTDMLDLRSAGAAVEAQFTDAQADCTVAEFHLAAAAGLSVEEDLPQLTSVPFAGHFPISDRKEMAAWAAWQTETEIPRWEIVINDHAAAVSMADATRAAATADFIANRTSLERAIMSIAAQASETSAFLDGLTHYNGMIARYVLSNAAPNSTAASLATRLMTDH